MLRNPEPDADEYEALEQKATAQLDAVEMVLRYHSRTDDTADFVVRDMIRQIVRED